MKFKVAQECGQKWYLAHCWSRSRLYRAFPRGFAIGPIMFYRTERDV